MANAPRRNWTVSEDFSTLYMNGNELIIDLSNDTDDAKLFDRLYGRKQYLSDAMAGKTGTDALNAAKERNASHSDDAFELVRTDKGFGFRDPNATRTFGPRISKEEKAARENFLRMSKAEQKAMTPLLKKLYTNDAVVKYITGKADTI